MNNIGYIYKITNKQNGKIYVGKTKHTVSERFNQHISSSRKTDKLPSFSMLYAAMKKYGTDEFGVETIEECDISVLNERERYWIALLDARNPAVGYNICVGGEGGPGGPRMLGKHHSEETRRLMSENRKGSKNANYGNHHKMSDDQKDLYRKMFLGEGNPMYGKKHRADSNLKNSASHLGRKKMSNDAIYPNYKMVKPQEIEEYTSKGWYICHK